MGNSSRLDQILLLLLDANHAIPAEEIANGIQASRRTVFRELENATHFLDGFDIALISKPNSGIVLAGDAEAKKRLAKEIISREQYDPKNALQRRKKLLLTLLTQEEAMKTYTLASLLDVSEGTVKRDLEHAECWLAQSSVRVIKKPGLGVYIECEEGPYRKALMRFIHQNMDENDDVLHEVFDVSAIETAEAALHGLSERKIKAMTDISFRGLVIYLATMLSRVQANRFMPACETYCVLDEEGEDYRLANRIMEHLQIDMAGEYAEAELFHLFTYIKGVKLQTAQEIDMTSEDIDLLCLVYDMIQVFDTSIAYHLKNDEDLVKGLIAHLIPTIARLKNGMEIHNAFLQEIATQYPNTYKRAKQAVKVLEEKIHCAVPEEELGLLALHFGAACVRFQNDAKPRQKVTIGVVCSSGIGISALLSSKLMSVFAGKIHVCCLSLSDIENGIDTHIDMLVSTLDLPPEYHPYTKVRPMLGDDDIVRVTESIERFEKAVYASEPLEMELLGNVDVVAHASEEVASILTGFNIYEVEADVNFETLASLAGKWTGIDAANAAIIRDDLIKREALSTQVIPEHQIVLLHAKSKGVQDSKFILIRPKGERFADPHFQSAVVAVVMLIPAESKNRVMAIARISSAMFDHEPFLQSVKRGKKQDVKKYMDMTLRQYLKECLSII